MACESCKVLVKAELEKLGAHPVKVELGEVETKFKLTEKKERQFGAAIKKAGLELVKDKEALLTDQIKAAVTEYMERSSNIKINLLNI